MTARKDFGDLLRAHDDGDGGELIERVHPIVAPVFDAAEKAGKALKELPKEQSKRVRDATLDGVKKLLNGGK